MVVEIEVANFLVCKVLLDNGSSVDVLYWLAFKQLGMLESQIKPFPEQLIRFAKETTNTI